MKYEAKQSVFHSFYAVSPCSRLFFSASAVFVRVSRDCSAVGNIPGKSKGRAFRFRFPKTIPRPPWAVAWAVGRRPAPRLHQPGENVAFSLGIGVEMALVASKKFLRYNYYRK